MHISNNVKAEHNAVYLDYAATTPADPQVIVEMFQSDPSDLIWISGTTESVNLAIKSISVSFITRLFSASTSVVN